MPAQNFTVICVLCHRIVEPGPSRAAVSHTVCPSCVEWTTSHRNLEFLAGAFCEVGGLERPHESVTTD